MIITLIIDNFIHPLGQGITSPLFSSFFDAFFVAGFTEEFAKFAVLYWIVWKNKEFDQHFDGIIFAVCVSMGFALVENLMYVFEGGMKVALIRAVLAVPGHGLNAVVMGYYLSLAKFHQGPKKNEYLMKSFLGAAVMHSLYDFTLMYGAKNGANPLLAIILIIAFTYIVIKSWKIALRKIALHYEKDVSVINAQKTEIFEPPTE